MIRPPKPREKKFQSKCIFCAAKVCILVQFENYETYAEYTYKTDHIHAHEQNSFEDSENLLCTSL